MTDDEILEAIRGSHASALVPGRLGGHDVHLSTFRIGGKAPLTTVFRIRDGRLTLLRAADGSYREDLAVALLDAADRAPGRLGDVVHVQPLDLDGLALDRVVVYLPVQAYRGRPELSAATVRVVPAHRSEVRPGESRDEFEETTGKSMRLPVDEWARSPRPRAAVRLLDDWPGGPLARTRRAFPQAAEHVFTRTAPGLARGIRLEATDVRGHRLVVSRTWDRLTGTLILSTDGTVHPVDIPISAPWATLSPIFSGDPVDPRALAAPSHPDIAEDLLEFTYETADRGWASVPLPTTLESCLTRLRGQILRTPGNFGVFYSRSGAIVQVRRCPEDEPPLWLETPYPDVGHSLGRHVTVEEAERLITILAREDRSAVPELDDLTTVTWS